MPTATGSGVSVFVTARSADGLTVVAAAAVLLLVVGSFTLDATVALLEMLPVDCGRPLTWIVALAPLPTVPSWQVTVTPDCPQLPCDGVAESKIIPAGRVWVTTVLVAARGPLLPTVRLYVTCCPTSTGSGESTLVNDRFAFSAGAL